MTALHLIAAEYRLAAAELADMDMDAQTVADTLDSLTGALEHKALSMAMLVRSLESEAAAEKLWADNAKKHADAKQARADEVRAYISQEMLRCEIGKFSAPGIALSFRKSSAVEIDDASLVPAEFCEPPTPAPPPAPSKMLLKPALSDGRAVPGARLVWRQHLQIK